MNLSCGLFDLSQAVMKHFIVQIVIMGCSWSVTILEYVVSKLIRDRMPAECQTIGNSLKFQTLNFIIISTVIL